MSHLSNMATLRHLPSPIEILKTGWNGWNGWNRVENKGFFPFQPKRTWMEQTSGARRAEHRGSAALKGE